ncbi:MAG: hypothetical protein DMG07_12470 [Acidobacteria bacterium]|nr:MAG: hypothetical protein DMG07_12470 [Acidobacteriota bacterium]
MAVPAPRRRLPHLEGGARGRRPRGRRVCPRQARGRPAADRRPQLRHRPAPAGVGHRDREGGFPDGPRPGARPGAAARGRHRGDQVRPRTAARQARADRDRAPAPGPQRGRGCGIHPPPGRDARRPRGPGPGADFRRRLGARGGPRRRHHSPGQARHDRAAAALERDDPGDQRAAQAPLVAQRGRACAQPRGRHGGFAHPVRRRRGRPGDDRLRAPGARSDDLSRVPGDPRPARDCRQGPLRRAAAARGWEPRGDRGNAQARRSGLPEDPERARRQQRRRVRRRAPGGPAAWVPLARAHVQARRGHGRGGAISLRHRRRDRARRATAPPPGVRRSSRRSRPCRGCRPGRAPGSLPACLVCSLGTDGTDGPTDAAGAVADSRTLARSLDLAPGLLEAALENNDSYNFFARLGDLIITGPTRTNVVDLHVVLVG